MDRIIFCHEEACRRRCGVAVGLQPCSAVRLPAVGLHHSQPGSWSSPAVGSKSALRRVSHVFPHHLFFHFIPSNFRPKQKVFCRKPILLRLHRCVADCFLFWGRTFFFLIFTDGPAAGRSPWFHFFQPPVLVSQWFRIAMPSPTTVPCFSSSTRQPPSVWPLQEHPSTFILTCAGVLLI